MSNRATLAWGIFAGIVLSAAINITDLHIRICAGPAHICQQHWSGK